MRNVLLTFSLLLFAGMSFGQIKVITTGETGIGTSTPNEQLEVAGNIRLDNSANSTFQSINGPASNLMELQVTQGTDSQAALAFFAMKGNAGGGAGKFTCAGSFIDLKYNKGAGDFGVTGMRMTTTGDVGIGTNSPATKLEVNGAVTTSGGVFFNGGSTSAAKSGSRLEYGLETIMAMKPSMITNDAKVKRGETSFYSLNTKEIASIAPEFILTHTQVDYKPNGDEIEIVAEEEYNYVNSTLIQLTLINAMQEQQELIEAQNERIAEMEATILNMANGTTQAVEVRDSRLGQNAPNPFNQSTVISYTVPSKANTAVMQIFDLNGQLLKTVNVANGNGQLTINAGELAAGTYSYNLVVDGAIVDTKKMVLTK